MERENWLHGEGCLHVFPPAGVAVNSQLKVLPYILYPRVGPTVPIHSGPDVPGFLPLAGLTNTTRALVRNNTTGCLHMGKGIERSPRPSICTLYHGRPLLWVSHWL